MTAPEPVAAAPRWAYEDLVEGLTVDIGTKTIDADEIVAFAAEFDPQPFHVDEAAGQQSIMGGLAASGWHTCSVFMRMMCDAFLLDSTSQGAPGIESIRWKRPVLAGDTLSGVSKVISRRLSQKRPTLGFVVFRHELANQHGEIVLELENTGMFQTRGAA